MIFAKFLHVMGMVIWVGGMFFAYMALRPVAAERLEPPQRLMLWEGVFSRFFPWVWACIVTILFTGIAMLMMVNKPGMYLMLMATLGMLMMLLFGHVYFALYLKLKRAVAAQDWPTGGMVLGKIRTMIAINLTLGLLTITVATLGPLLG